MDSDSSHDFSLCGVIHSSGEVPPRQDTAKWKREREKELSGGRQMVTQVRFLLVDAFHRCHNSLSLGHVNLGS